MDSQNNLTDSELMESIREYQVIYDRGCVDFKNKKMKRISEVLKADVPSIMKRYENVRTAFGRYLKSLKPASGSGRDLIVINKKWEHIRWLMPYIKHRGATISNINNKIPLDDNEEVKEIPTAIDENRPSFNSGENNIKCRYIINFFDVHSLQHPSSKVVYRFKDLSQCESHSLYVYISTRKMSKFY